MKLAGRYQLVMASWLSIIAVISVAGCKPQSAAEPVTARPSEAPSEAAKLSALEIQGGPIPMATIAPVFRVPENYQFAGVTEVAGAADSAEALARYTERERSAILAYYARHSRRVFDFSGPQQLEWMAQRGYPMPDDILRSSTLSDAQLEEMVALQNVKAAFFLLDRLADAAINTNAPLSMADADRANQLLSKALASRSPFAGYVYARYSQAIGQDRSVALAAINLAQQAGDNRASLAIDDLGEGIDAPAALAAYSALELQTASATPDWLDPRRHRRLPPAQR